MAVATRSSGWRPPIGLTQCPSTLHDPATASTVRPVELTWRWRGPQGYPLTPLFSRITPFAGRPPLENRAGSVSDPPPCNRLERATDMTLHHTVRHRKTD